MSTSSICSARRTTSSGTVSCWRTPVIRSTTSLSDLQVLHVHRGQHVDARRRAAPRRPASASRCGDPGALVCASSSTSTTSGVRASTASRSISSNVGRRGRSVRRGSTSRPSSSSAVVAGRASRPARPPRRCPAPAGAAPRRAWRRSCRPRAPRRGRSAAHRAGHILPPCRPRQGPTRFSLVPGAARARLSSVTFTARLAEEPQVAPAGGLRDQLAAPAARQPGHPGHPGDLQRRVGRADVRVEAGGRGGHRVRWAPRPGSTPSRSAIRARRWFTASSRSASKPPLLEPPEVDGVRRAEHVVGATPAGPGVEVRVGGRVGRHRVDADQPRADRRAVRAA